MKMKIFAMTALIFCATIAAVQSVPKHPPKETVATAYEKGNDLFIQAAPVMAIAETVFVDLPSADIKKETAITVRAIKMPVEKYAGKDPPRWQCYISTLKVTDKRHTTEPGPLAHISLPPAWLC